MCGFVNGVAVVENLGKDFSITSYSLRSLCKTVLSDTNPTTASASDRSQVLIQIIRFVNFYFTCAAELPLSLMQGGRKHQFLPYSLYSSKVCSPLNSSSTTVPKIEDEDKEQAGADGISSTGYVSYHVFQSMGSNISPAIYMSWACMHV